MTTYAYIRFPDEIIHQHMMMKTNKSLYGVLDKLGSDHWWYRAKNNLIKMFLETFSGGGGSGDRSQAVLDIGCGAGNLSKDLQDLGYQVTSVDLSEDAINYCYTRGLIRARVADAARLPFPSNYFDFAVASEILEHIQDDGKTMKEIRRVMKPGGVVIITVPAIPMLWSYQDVYWGHFRRYTRHSLEVLLQNEHFQILKLSYFNFSLFLPAALIRIFSNLFTKKSDRVACDEYKSNNGLIGSLFTGILKIEKEYLKKYNFPIGISLCAVVKK